MRLFQAKHQKLILQCYPPGRGVDKKPNSSELSYLLYYASTRRVKLEKVGTFLEKRATSDVNHNRVGNTQVTLDILRALIEKCSDNLNVIASYIISILLQVFHTKDLALCQNAIPVFKLFTEKLDGDLFTGDRLFVESFIKLGNCVIDLGYNAKKPNELEWKLIGLQGAESLANCVSYSSSAGKTMIEKSMPFILDSVYENFEEVRQLLKVRSHDENELARVSTSRTLQTHNKVEDTHPESVTKSLQEEAMRSLRAFFNTTAVSQIIESTKGVLNYNLENLMNITQKMSDVLLQMIVNWVPVQLRFVILGTLLNTLAGSKSYDTQLSIAKCTFGLVSSKVNMIGLSVTDVIQQLLTLNQTLIMNVSGKLSSEQVDSLSTIYCDCITNLATHVYYFNQVSDVVGEILLRATDLYVTDPVKPNTITADSEGVVKSITIFLNNITQIFQELKRRVDGVQRNNCTIEVWDYSFHIFADQSHLSLEHRIKIQELYLALFGQFLVDELDISEISKPDYNQYITHQENSLSHYFISLDKYFHLDVEVSKDLRNTPNVINKIISNTKLMVDSFGVNFIANGVPFFFHWQLPIDRESKEYTTSDLLKDGFAYSFLHQASVHMKLPELSHNISQIMSNRKQSGLFIDELELGIPFIQHPDQSTVAITRNSLHKLIVERGELASSWIDPNKSLILDFLAGNGNGPISNGMVNGFISPSVNSSQVELQVHIPDGSAPRSARLSPLHDIHSIGSGAMSPSAASFLSGRKINSPRVSELREAVSGGNLRSNISFLNGGEPSSIMSRTTDLTSILDELTFTEDHEERAIVV